MPQNVDIKEYLAFSSEQINVLAQYNSSLGIVQTKGVALSAFNLSYGGSSHFVQSITVQAGNPSNAGDDRFSFTAQASMQDDSDNKAVSAATFAVPAVLAGSAAGTSLEFQTRAIQPNDPSVGVDFGSSLSQAYVVLGGFSVAYSDTEDHQVLSLKAKADFPPNTSTTGTTSLRVTGSATISDGQTVPHTGSGSVQVMAIGQVAGDRTKFDPKTWNIGDGQVTSQLSDTDPINQAVVFIKSFELNYSGSDQDVRTILLDAGNNSLNITNFPATRTATITFTPQLIMTDGSKNATGTLELLVMAVPNPLPPVP